MEEINEMHTDCCLHLYLCHITDSPILQHTQHNILHTVGIASGIQYEFSGSYSLRSTETCPHN